MEPAYFTPTQAELALPELANLPGFAKDLFCAVVHTLRLGLFLAQPDHDVRTFDQSHPGEENCRKYVISALSSAFMADKMFPLRKTGATMQYIIQTIRATRMPMTFTGMIFQLCIWRTFAFGNKDKMVAISLNTPWLKYSINLDSLASTIKAWASVAHIAVPAYGNLQIRKDFVKDMLEKLMAFSEKVSVVSLTHPYLVAFAQMQDDLTDRHIHAIPEHGLISWVLVSDLFEFGLCLPPTPEDLVRHITNTNARGAKNAVKVIAEQGAAGPPKNPDEIVHALREIMAVFNNPPAGSWVKILVDSCALWQERPLNIIDIEHVLCKLSRQASRAKLGKGKKSEVKDAGETKSDGESEIKDEGGYEDEDEGEYKDKDEDEGEYEDEDKHEGEFKDESDNEGEDEDEHHESKQEVKPKSQDEHPSRNEANSDNTDVQFKIKVEVQDDDDDYVAAQAPPNETRDQNMPSPKPKTLIFKVPSQKREKSRDPGDSGSGSGSGSGSDPAELEMAGDENEMPHKKKRKLLPGSPAREVIVDEDYDDEDDDEEDDEDKDEDEDEAGRGSSRGSSSSSDPAELEMAEDESKMPHKEKRKLLPDSPAREVIVDENYDKDEEDDEDDDEDKDEDENEAGRGSSSNSSEGGAGGVAVVAAAAPIPTSLAGGESQEVSARDENQGVVLPDEDDLYSA
ncbi:hypothetical protein LZ554_007077 [Drepanopeziza brunnea f. sp. 'monogermtubi']|nr:hypothetical protein LZ554_007077 [Drepanopeziza brunnea f. sp. 'monogermtubi']